MDDPMANQLNKEQPSPYVPRPEDEEAIIDDQSSDPRSPPKDEEAGILQQGGALKRGLASRHIQMIGIGISDPSIWHRSGPR